MFYLLEILGVFLQNTIIFGGFRAYSWGILKISSGNTDCAFKIPNQTFIQIYRMKSVRLSWPSIVFLKLEYIIHGMFLNIATFSVTNRSQKRLIFLNIFT
jgi:hypothetical protein